MKRTVRPQGRIRKRSGQMNKLEAAYAAVLKADKGVLWWGYEAIKLRLADNTYYTPDFAVLLSDGQFEFHETKGFMRDDANVKIKVAAETFPFRFYLVERIKGEWRMTEK